MFGWFRPKCPIDLSQATVVDQHMSQLAQTLGLARLRAAVVIRPTREFFPEPFVGADGDAQRIYRQACSWMGVNPERARLELVDDDIQGIGARGGMFLPGSPGMVVVRRSRLKDPMALTTAVAIGLAQLLLDDAGLRPPGREYYALAETLTVFLGLGVFPANTTMQESHEQSRGWFRWRIQREGALSEKQFGYALALFAWVRDAPAAPAWSADLRPNLRAVFVQSLNYLRKTGDAQFKPADDEAGLDEGRRLARRLEALSSSSRGARLAALWDLREWGPRAAAAVGPALAIMKEEDSPLNVQATELLGAIGAEAEAAVPALSDAALQDHDQGLRSAAAAALGNIGRKPEAAVPVLTYLLKSETPNERILAAWALGRFGSDAGGAVGPLTEMLQEGNDAVAAEAAYALGAIGGIAVAAVPALIEALRRGEGALPCGAAYALGCMGSAATQKTLAALRKALRHMDPVVVEEAADALRRLGFADGDVAAAGPAAEAKRRTAVYQIDPRFR